MSYEVRPSKGDFLLHTVMNIAGYNENNRYPNLHPLRLKVREHYAREINNPLILRFYNEWLSSGVHNHPHWGALTDIQRLEFGLTPQDGKGSKEIREILESFRSSTDFDQFYAQITPEYQDICGQLSRVLGKIDMEGILNSAWEFCADFGVVIIPRPLDKPYHGDGPKIGETAVSIVGPGDVDNTPTYKDDRLRHLVAHEVSHTYAKKVIEEIIRIATSRGSAQKIDEFGAKQKSSQYRGAMVLEETMMRALQLRYIDPFMDLGNDRSIDRDLIREHERGKFEYIFSFDEAIRQHKEKPKGTFAEAMVRLTEKLADQNKSS
jgi:hypothetical protein